ncbi:ParB/RepB/Spo0J family partition protein [Microvirga massiliensis]|uniref:ParB/RepB/Spo0J family partition protein n=1 Tax=Microvirga massiliensis TaxID=1033741 RepID=UPI00069ABDB1|nr:ParB/RepB/Spo0J family partition protein [Microvirga massiliensis]
MATQSAPVQELPIADIVVGERFRKDLGDIVLLAESIERLGLLQPIGVTQDRRLIFGERRIEAFKHLGRETIPARVLDIESILEGEFDENETRKEFTVSERVALARAIEKELEGRQGRPTTKTVEPVPGFVKGHTRDLVAERVGLGSGKTYENAKTVVAKGAPELVAAVDEGKVAIKPAAEFAKQAPEKQAELIKQAGDAKAAVVEFRKSLPTKQDARKIAAETGNPTLGRDGKFHTDATDEERRQGDLYLQLCGGMRAILGLGLTPEEALDCVTPDSDIVFGPLIDRLAPFIRDLEQAWRRRNAA